MVLCSLYFDQVWIAVIVSCCKKKRFDEGGELHLSVGIKTSIKNVVRYYIGIGKQWW